jgi:hypothetical protein
MYREYLKQFHYLTPILDDLKLYQHCKYFKVVSMIGKDNQEHHGILVERIHDSFMVKPGWVPLKEERITHKTLADL